MTLLTSAQHKGLKQNMLSNEQKGNATKSDKESVSGGLMAPSTRGARGRNP